MRIRLRYFFLGVVVTSCFSLVASVGLRNLFEQEAWSHQAGYYYFRADQKESSPIFYWNDEGPFSITVKKRETAGRWEKL